ncbi:integral membrane sensor signal transduction histidine kinase [Desulfonatronospira thiodismutans ASO3-1]|uniref:histidine kinase n=1 Tax=Desulfonatronospira thiodismutans ASO3-1 TaxID=555779 RepID=D6SNC7_9BACT|nr:sensor histidine kinase [Desulfonatronospira thiodismutans]EFI34253.1 integral membrane sensor signal transduction histidine kinase [Desulfonatronospira thiodismutans ASO3-1]
MNKKLLFPGVLLLAILYTAIGGLAYNAGQELEGVVTQQFNDQQLILAEKIADDIRGHFQFLETALATLSRQTVKILPEQPSHDYLHSTHDILKDWHVLSLGIAGNAPDNSLMAPDGSVSSWKDMGIDFPREEFQLWLDSDPDGQVFFSRTFRPDQGPYAGTWIMVMVKPLSRDLEMSFESGNFEGMPPAAFFVVDAMKVSRDYAHGVISGQTGYPWVINEEGYFLYHIEDDFDGRDSFTVRHERNPDISYERINTIVSQRLLAGDEGTDWYISGWHREVYTEMKKLLAFSPVFFTHQEKKRDSHLWSVGVAAPDEEVWGLIQPIVVRQWVVAGLFLVGATLGLFGLYFLSLRWNHVLTRKVEDKTRHLMESREQLREEKEKVEQSMQKLKDTQQRLVQSERFAAIGEAASHMSHEIKNPLMLMAGFAGQVRRRLSEDSPEAEKLDIIVNEAKRLEKMLVEVRDFTRPHKLSIKPCQPNDLIAETVKIFQDSLESSGIVCSQELSTDLTQVNMDPDQVKQVLVNLIKNAVEVMPEGGTLGISSKRQNQWVVVSVQDSGPGIPAEKLKNIFSPFYTTKDKGTGLGLAVSYRIIQDHGGDIFVDSQEGHGARFTIYLPLEEANL